MIPQFTEYRKWNLCRYMELQVSNEKGSDRLKMLQVEHLSYDVLEEGKQSEILNDVSFTVNDGEMLVITGPNGGGKSTLAKLLMGNKQGDIRKDPAQRRGYYGVYN